MRHKQLYDWWHDMPDEPLRIKPMHWFGEWTGARDPYHGNDQGVIPSGFGCRNADEAYDRYVAFLEAYFHPGRLGPPPRSIAAPSEPEDINQLVNGIGNVCVLASALEFSLAYLTSTIDQWDDDKHRNVLATPGQPLREYRNLVPRLFPALRADAEQLADDAGRLLAERNRVIHSVMMLKTADEPRYEAWHAKTDTTWPAVPKDLNTLAHDLAEYAAEATGFAMAWQERAERDGWPVLP